MTTWAKATWESASMLAGFSWTESLTVKYVPLLVLAVLLVLSLIKGIRVWEEIHDVEEPDTPAIFSRRSRKLTPRGSSTMLSSAARSRAASGRRSAALLGDSLPSPQNSSGMAPEADRGDKPGSVSADPSASTGS